MLNEWYVPSLIRMMGCVVGVVSGVVIFTDVIDLAVDDANTSSADMPTMLAFLPGCCSMLIINRIMIIVCRLGDGIQIIGFGHHYLLPWTRRAFLLLPLPMPPEWPLTPPLPTLL